MAELTNSKDLQRKILDAFDSALSADEPKPQVIAAAVTYLKAFPPDEAPSEGQLTPEQQDIVNQYADKVKVFPRKEA